MIFIHIFGGHHIQGIAFHGPALHMWCQQLDVVHLCPLSMKMIQTRKRTKTLKLCTCMCLYLKMMNHLSAMSSMCEHSSFYDNFINSFRSFYLQAKFSKFKRHSLNYQKGLGVAKTQRNTWKKMTTQQFGEKGDDLKHITHLDTGEVIFKDNLEYNFEDNRSRTSQNITNVVMGSFCTNDE